MNEYQLKDKLTEVMRGKAAKIWLTRATGHRLDFVWSVGEAQVQPAQQLAHMGNYYLVGQEVPPDLLPKVMSLFEEFCEGQEFRAPPPPTQSQSRFVPML